MELQQAAVIGHPLGHTMSPFIHQRLFALSQIPAEYHVLDIEDLCSAESELQKLSVFNVTIPHKSGIIPLLHRLHPKAEAFGSVNTVKVENGEMIGYTTDGTGCLKALQNHGVGFEGALLILGNGGAARAIAFEAVEQAQSPHITIACRESALERTETLCRQLCDYGKTLQKKLSVQAKTYAQLESRPEAYAALLNATSVGMHPKEGASPVSGAVVAHCGLVFDAVYNPAETTLLRLAKQVGVPVVGGMEMLVYQAVAAHEIWYGSHFAKGDIEKLCADAQAEMARTFLKG